MTRDERRQLFEAYADVDVRAYLHRRARGIGNAQEELRTMMRAAYRLGVKDGQAIALEAQEPTKVPA